MSEEEGPLMLAATDVLRPPQARIAKIGPNITLPRSVPIRSVAAGVVGFIIALPFAAIGGRFIGLQAFIFFSMAGIIAGAVIIQWQPQKGETLLQIFGVRAQTAMRQQKVEIDGETLSLSVGMARISRVNVGPCHIIPGAVEVNPLAVDERGAIRSAKNKNLLPFVPTAPAPDADQPRRLALPDDVVSDASVGPPPARRRFRTRQDNAPDRTTSTTTADTAPEFDHIEDTPPPRPASRLTLPSGIPDDFSEGGTRPGATPAPSRLHLPDSPTPATGPGHATQPHHVTQPHSEPVLHRGSSRLNLPDEPSGPGTASEPSDDALLTPPDQRPPARRSRLNLPE